MVFSSISDAPLHGYSFGAKFAIVWALGFLFSLGHLGLSTAWNVLFSGKAGPSLVSADELAAHDLSATRKEFIFRVPSPLFTLLRTNMVDERDAPIVHHLFTVTVTSLPLALALLFSDDWPLWVAFVYLGFTAVMFFQTFILTLHFTTHRPVFKNSWSNPLNWIPLVGLSPLFGLPPNVYYLHHVVMHHLENNVFPHDLSATMQYRRDSLVHFMEYWARYFFGTWVQLPYYAMYRKRYRLAVSSVVWSISYWAAIYWLYNRNAAGTLFTLILPFFISSFALMFGNWSQHIFVDPDRYDDNYGLSYNVIGAPMNQLTYNDGYHLCHHLHSQKHWSELPAYFRERRERFAEKDAMTFRDVDFFEIGVLVFLGRLDILAKRWVHIGPPGTEKSEAELIALFKKCLQPISVDPAKHP